MGVSDPETGEMLSRDAGNSTYTQADDVADANPPSGPSVIQTLGKATDTTTASTKTSTKSSSTSSS